MADEQPLPTHQRVWGGVLVIALAALFYSAHDMLSKHTTWNDFSTPAGVGEVFWCFFVVALAVAAALKIEIPAFTGAIKSFMKSE